MTGEGHDDWLSDCDFHPRYYLFLSMDLTIIFIINIRLKIALRYVWFCGKIRKNNLSLLSYSRLNLYATSFFF